MEWLLKLVCHHLSQPLPLEDSIAAETQAKTSLPRQDLSLDFEVASDERRSDALDEDYLEL